MNLSVEISFTLKNPSDYFHDQFLLGDTCFSETVAGAVAVIGSPRGSERVWGGQARLAAGFSDRTHPAHSPCKLQQYI